MRRCVVARCAGQMAVLLREIIERAPSSGISLDDVEVELGGRMQAAATTETETETRKPPLPHSWREALPEVNDVHYVCGTTLYPCNWEETMRGIAADMPREGVTEKELLKRIVGVEARFSPRSVSLGEPMCRWVRRRFPQILNVSRSAVDGTPIYRVVEEPLPPEAESITRALQLLGRGKLPVYTDVGLIASLLPASMCPGKGNWMRLLEREEVRQHFDVDVNVSVRLSPERAPVVVCVDATSVEVSQIGKILVEKGLSGSLCDIKVFRRASSPSWTVDDVVVQSFLEPEHAIGAAIASMGINRSHESKSNSSSSSSNNNNNTKVYVLCGEVARERYKTALGDLLGHEGTEVNIFSPSNGAPVK